MTDTVPVLWHSNAPWAPSGYGNQTKQFAPRVRDLGYDVAISAFYGANGAHLSYHGMKVYPGTGNPYGNDILTPHAAHHFGTLKAGLVVTLMDVFVLAPALFDMLNAACWVPIDHDPVPPAIVQFFVDAPRVTPIAMSVFGQRALQAALPGRVVEYIPHGIDTDVFKPMDEGGRIAARRGFGVEDERFIVGMVAANQGAPSRKSIPEAIAAFAAFKKQRPDSLLYLHTCRDTRYGGVDIEALLRINGLGKDDVRFVPQYDYLTGALDDDYMVKAYNAMDVFLNPSMGEGFGIPIIEAQACGVPVIVSDFTACPEVGKVGWHVGGQRFWTAQGSWQIVPNINDIVSSLVQAHDGMAFRKRGAARDHALGYDADLLTETMWKPLLERLTSGIGSHADYLVPESLEPAR